VHYKRYDYCSVIDPNCKRWSAGEKYAAFVGCEVAVGIGTIDDAQTPNTKHAGTSVFLGVNATPFLFAAYGQPIKALGAAAGAYAYDISFALRTRETCVRAVYGPGYF